MIPYHSQHNVTIYCDDCVTAMQNMEDNSIDAIVTDPPYGLSKQPDIVEVLTHWLNGDDYEHTGSGFMNKGWDSFVPGPSVWRECLRVLKPGGHLLAFAGTRTVDLMGISLRLGGFEIRDMVAWVTGQGFPKSLSIGKAIDRAQGMEREIVGIAADFSYDGANRKTDGSHMKPTQQVPNGDRWSQPITAPATPEAQQYEGFGTGLKPALSPILLCRKPISEKNIAANVLRWGTGGLAIDRCRVGVEENDPNHRSTKPSKNLRNTTFPKIGGINYGQSPKGRFPANLIIDDSDEVRALFPESRERIIVKSGGDYSFNVGKTKGIRHQSQTEGIKTSAARFFYCAKSSKAERNAGLEGSVTNGHPCVKPLSLMRYLCRLITPPNGLILDPFAGSGSTLIAAREENFKAIGVELEEDYCQIAVGRLSQVQPNLFNIGD